MKKTLVIFAHPHFEYSHSNVELIKAYDGFEELDFKDLYEEYPCDTKEELETRET